MKLKLFFVLSFFHTLVFAQNVDYSVVQANEESGIKFTQITTDNDYVCLPIVKRTSKGVNWLSNRIIDISVEGTHIAYLSARNNTTNIFIKELGKMGSSVQRTNRQAILDFSYSPDGKYIAFSEASGKQNQIFQTDATKGYVCRQITSGNNDYSPTYSSDMKEMYFARKEMNGISIWSYNIGNNFMSSYTAGYNPCPEKNRHTLLCSRTNTEGRSEIWRINTETGIEECVVSDPQRSFTTPMVSPNGQWIIFVGTGLIPYGNEYFYNTDIFACRTDGTDLMQMTYHAADDLSPVWSKDGSKIYFISQRGSATGTANIWSMNFNHFE